MKRQITFFAIAILISACSLFEPDIYMFSYFQNNGEDGLHLAFSEDGLTWSAINNNKSFLTPNVGNDKLMRDPCIILDNDNKFHMVWTVSWNEKGVGYSSSEDLINWSEQKYIPVMEHIPTARNCWAPELFYDENLDQYLIYWSTTIPGKFPETDSTGDNGYNHRLYYTTTKDFEIFNETKLLFDPGFNVIDATIQKVENNYLMFFKNETKKPVAEKNIGIAKSKNLYGNYKITAHPITDNWVEGPTITKTTNGWICYFDEYTRHKMGGVISDDLRIWKNIADKIQFPVGTRHGTVFKIKESVLSNLISLTIE
jgi:predicted GH43/DUF377 family glycosyl hydrolase